MEAMSLHETKNSLRHRRHHCNKKDYVVKIWSRIENLPEIHEKNYI